MPSNECKRHERGAKAQVRRLGMSRLDEMQHEFMEQHCKDADLIECYAAPPNGNGKVIRAIYFSPVYKADEPIRKFFRAVQEAELAAGDASLSGEAEGR